MTGLAAIENPAGESIRFMYTKEGCLETIIDSAGRRLQVKSDAQNRILELAAPDPNRPGFLFTVISYTYAENNDLVEVPDALLQPWKYTYQEHLLVREINRNNLNFFFEYENLNSGARCKRTWSDGGIYYREFTYDLSAKKTEVKNADGHITTHFWNERGMVTKTIDALGGISLKEYGKFGDVIRETDPLGNTTLYEYDQGGNTSRIVYADKSEIIFKYKEDLLLEVADQMGRVKSIARASGISSEYLYDTQDRVTDILHSDGFSEQYRYQPDGELLEARNAESRVKFEYDKLGRPLKQTIWDGKGESRSREYTWDLDDRLRSVMDSLHVPIHYAHDTFGNLISAAYGDGRILYRIPDAVGNLFRTKEREDRVYGRAGELLEARGLEGITKYEYDAEGNLCLKILSDGKQWRYGWNSQGRLVKVWRTDGTTVLFAYDPCGCRLSKRTGTQVTRWVWDGNVVLHE